MDWIKKNPAQTALAVVSVGAIAASFFLWQTISEFPSKLTGKDLTPNPRNDVPALDLKPITDSIAAVPKPGAWTFDANTQSPFVSDQYVKSGAQIRKPEGESFVLPMTNLWLKKHGLDFLNPNVGSEDPDKDGFTTLLEWDGMDAKSHLSETTAGEKVMGADGNPLPEDMTNPVDPASHPPYHTRLRLAPLPNGQLGIVSIPFRLKFMAADIDERKPENSTVQINPIDKGNRTFFVPLKAPIPNTDFIAEKYEKKEVPGTDGIKKDVSELTVFNPRTNKRIVLPIGVTINSPESFVVLRYLWVANGGQPTPDINKKKDETFTLPPENDKVYKVIDIKPPNPENGAPGEVTIQLPSGGTLILKTNDKFLR